MISIIQQKNQHQEINNFKIIDKNKVNLKKKIKKKKNCVDFLFKKKEMANNSPLVASS